MVSGIELARLRQGSLRLLAAGYGRPSPESTSRIATGFDVLLELGAAQFAFAAPIGRWVDSLAGADPVAVASEYVRLFGAGMDGAVCPPIESQQLGENLQGDPARYASRIEDLMRRSGFSARGTALPPDHLVTELELASALCGGEAAAREQGTGVLDWLGWQSELVLVLRKWISGFASDVAARDRSGAFRDLTAATVAFIEHDHDVVRLLTTAVGGTE